MARWITDFGRGVHGFCGSGSHILDAEWITDSGRRQLVRVRYWAVDEAMVVASPLPATTTALAVILLPPNARAEGESPRVVFNLPSRNVAVAILDVPRGIRIMVAVLGVALAVCRSAGRCRQAKEYGSCDENCDGRFHVRSSGSRR